MISAQEENTDTLSTYTTMDHKVDTGCPDTADVPYMCRDVCLCTYKVYRQSLEGVAWQNHTHTNTHKRGRGKQQERIGKKQSHP